MQTRETTLDASARPGEVVVAAVRERPEETLKAAWRWGTLPDCGYSLQSALDAMTTPD